MVFMQIVSAVSAAELGAWCSLCPDSSRAEKATVGQPQGKVS